MSQNFNNSNGPPHASPPRQANGFEDLMGSLRSPGNATTIHQGFQMPQWPGQTGWAPTNGNAGFPYNMPLQTSPLNQMVWGQNGQESYIGLQQDDGEYSVDDNEGLVGDTITRQSLQSKPPFTPGGVPSLAASSPLTLPPPRANIPSTTAAMPVSESPKVSSAATTARAAELRAKLLASRGSKPVSRQNSPAAKAKDLGDAKKTQLMEILKQSNGTPVAKDQSQNIPANPLTKAAGSQKTNEKTSLQAPVVSPTTTTASLGGAIDNLMSEARDAADATRSQVSTANVALKKPGQIEAGPITNGAQPNTKPKPIAPPNKSRSPSELSEPGEIRSGPATPEAVVPAPQPPAAALDTAETVHREEQEKLARQNEVKKTYQPLKKSKGATKPEPKGVQGKPQAPKKAPLVNQQQLPKKPDAERTGGGGYERVPIREEPRREQLREQARDFDRRDDTRDLRRASASQVYPNSREIERELAIRRKATEDNSRRAAEYKRSLDAERAAVRQPTSGSSQAPKETTKQGPENIRSSQVTSKTPSRKTSMISDANNVETPIERVGNAIQDVDTVMQSPAAKPDENDEDVNDWLELTRFYDEEYRDRKLKIFRKKKALDLQRAELEREEDEMELQEKTLRTRAQSTIPPARSTSVLRQPSIANVRMPPPPLPLREANPDSGIKIKDTALSAGLAPPQTSPSLKRQYAEDDTEPSRTAQPTDKRLRLDTNGISSDERSLTSPASANRPDRYAPVKGEPLALENRISRHDDWPPPRGRPRSRSPEYSYRRRSFSPRPLRRYSGEYPYPRDLSQPRRPNDGSCFNCGQNGHVHAQCKQPRRDGREPVLRGYDQYVSPAYKGKNPGARRATPQHQQQQGGPSRSRYSSVGRAEDGEVPR